MRLTGADRHRGLEARGTLPLSTGVGRRQPGWRVFSAPDGRCRVSPDLIRVINVPFEAQEIAQSCGRGAQITGWGDPHSIGAPVKSMSQWVRQGER